MNRNSQHDQFTEESGDGSDHRIEPSLSEEYFRSVTDNDEPAKVHTNPKDISQSASSFASCKTPVFVLHPYEPACCFEPNVGNDSLNNRPVPFNTPTSQARNNCEREYTRDLWSQPLSIKSNRATCSSVYTPVWCQKANENSYNWGEHDNMSNHVGALDTNVKMAGEEKQWRGLDLHEIFLNNEARGGKEREIQKNREETETIINVFQRHSNGQITHSHPYKHHQLLETGHQPAYRTNVVYEVLKLHPRSQDHHDKSESPSQVAPLTHEHLERFNFSTNREMQLYNVSTPRHVDKNPEPKEISSENQTSKTKESSKKSHSKQQSQSRQTSADRAESEEKGSEKEVPSKHDSVSTAGSSQRSASRHQSRKKDKPTHRSSSRHKSSKNESSRTHKSTKKPGHAQKVENEQSTSEDEKEKRKKSYCHCRKENCKCKKGYCESRDKNNKTDSNPQIAQVHRNTKKKVSSMQTEGSEPQTVGCKKPKPVEVVKSPQAAPISKSPTQPPQRYEPPVKEATPKSPRKETPISSSQTYEPPVKEPPPKSPRKKTPPPSTKKYEPPVKEAPPKSPRKETPISSSQTYGPPVKEPPPKSPRKKTPPPSTKKYEPPVNEPSSKSPRKKTPPPSTQRYEPPVNEPQSKSPRKETPPPSTQRYEPPVKEPPPKSLTKKTPPPSTRIYEPPVKHPSPTSPIKETTPSPKEKYISQFDPRYESPVNQQPTTQRNEKLQPLSPKNPLTLPPRYESPITKPPPPITSFAEKVAKEEQSKQPICSQKQTSYNKVLPADSSRPKPVTGNYAPVWYQKTGSNSSEWIDGSTYYANQYDPSNRVGAFAPHVNVEGMVRQEKRMRHIKDQMPYSDEDFTRSGRRRKKGTRSKHSNTVQQYETKPKTTQATTRSSYVMNLHGTSPSSRWNYDVPTILKRPTRSTSVFTSISKVNRPRVLFDDIHRYSSKPVLATESSVYNMTSVSSGLAPSAVGFQAYNASIGYDQTCDCDIVNCQCLYDCTSKKKTKPTGREFTNREECLNLSELSACSRGDDGSLSNLDTSAGSQPKKRVRKRRDIFIRRRSSGGDLPGPCSCKIDDCYCIYEPCASRKRGKKKLKPKPPKPMKPNKYKPPSVKSLEHDKCFLCHSDAIEIPFNWCMRMFCVTWVWSEREFKRHCGKGLGSLPDYTQKPPSLNESWLQRWWSKRYVGEDEEDVYT